MAEYNMSRLKFSDSPFDLVVGGMQLLFLLGTIVTFVALTVTSPQLTYRRFAFTLGFVYLFAITTVLRQQVQESPDAKKHAIVNWAFAAFVGTSLTAILISFVV
jgi:hypothetical protein